MILLDCENCKAEQLHFVCFITRFAGLELISIICEECGSTLTVFVEAGGWFKLVTGKSYLRREDN